MDKSILVEANSKDGSSARQHAQRIAVRVTDAFIREDFRELVSGGSITPGQEAPALLPQVSRTVFWLSRQLGHGTVHIPVIACHFMQKWRVAFLPLFWTSGENLRPIASLTEIVEVFSAGIDHEQRANMTVFLEECLTAIEHATLCGAARGLAVDHGHILAQHPAWHRKMMRHDCDGAFSDHPFYPTARAKVGFSEADLASYGPEYGRVFELDWLALPKEHFTLQGELPPVWPDFEQVGLDPALALDHVLLPVHPFMRGERMATVLQEVGLTDRAIHAPRSSLKVIPTLSVRALAVVDEPGLHIKLPLAIRTLGQLNLRAIQPDTIHDGNVIQSLLGRIGIRDRAIGERLLLTDESCGGCYSNHRFLSFILRRYPSAMEGACPVPVASLMAEMSDTRPLLLHLVDDHFSGDVIQFLTAYFELMLSIHLRLWARYGIALEANQQNSIILFDENTTKLRLLLKDNDSPRIARTRLAHAAPDLLPLVDDLRDTRIAGSDSAGLAQMVATITFQLNLAFVIEGLARSLRISPEPYYQLLRQEMHRHLAQLDAEGLDTADIRSQLIEPDYLPIKYLLRAASLESRSALHAADINKFYGMTAPNFLRAQ